MPPKIPVADNHTVATYGINLMTKGSYPDCSISPVNNFDTSFNTHTPATNERDVAIWNVIASIHT